MMEAIELVILSFIASVGFAIVFRMMGKDLLLAGLGGALTRCVYLFLLAHVETRIVYAGLAALAAALYAEVVSSWKQVPYTYFLYPAIIPLIPGDLLYNTVVGFIVQDAEMTLVNGENCILTLIGMSVGFVLNSTIIHYARQYRSRLNQVERAVSGRFKRSKNN
jgi:uncharacterized membrane protein YjjB (DUF3815 family)